MNTPMVDGLAPVRYPGEVLPWQRLSPPKQPRVLAPAAESVSTAPNRIVTTEQSRSFVRLAMFAVIGVIVISSIGYGITWRMSSHSTLAADTQTPIETTPAAMPKSPTPPPVSATQIQQTLNKFIASAGAPFFILVRDLKSGVTASVNPNQVMESASLYKLFVANQIYLLADRGQIDLNSTTGEGVNQTINQCLNAMITWSDNTCGRALGARIGWQKQAASLATQGITHTDLYSDPTRTNVADVATLYENLYAGKYLSQTSTAAFLTLLKAQKVNNRLPTDLPDGTVIAHKTGDLDGFMHDAGIVYGPKTNYLIVVMSGPWQNQNDSFAAIGGLSKQIYQQLEQ